jgi:hypothetical protein
MPVDWFCVGQLANVIRSISPKQQVPVSGCYVGMSGQNALAMHSLFYRDFAHLVQAIRKAFGETGRHVLGN